MEQAPVIMDNPPLQGFPFDNDIASGKSTIEEHLDKLAQKHPGIADQLKDWNSIKKRPRHNGPLSGSSTDKEEEDVTDTHKETPIRPKGASNLRNTVPDMQHNNQVQDEVDRAQRSQSAPPEALQKEIPVQKNDYVNTTQSPNCTPPPQHTQYQQNMRGPTVRHIPIFVEGRDEPLLPREANETSACPPHPQSPHYQPQPSNQQGMRPARKQQRAQQDYSIPIPVQIPQTQSCAQPAQPQSQQPQHQPSPQNHNSPSPAPQTQSPPTPPRIDPLDQVACVQKEVENLKEKIYSIRTISKTDREYIYLDEMLTRNLLKLDNIETEGREEVRAARKEAIKRIQECITILESLPDTQQSPELTCLTTASSESST